MSSANPQRRSLRPTITGLYQASGGSEGDGFTCEYIARGTLPAEAHALAGAPRTVLIQLRVSGRGGPAVLDWDVYQLDKRPTRLAEAGFFSCVSLLALLVSQPPWPSSSWLPPAWPLPCTHLANTHAPLRSFVCGLIGGVSLTRWGIVSARHWQIIFFKNTGSCPPGASTRAAGACRSWAPPWTRLTRSGTWRRARAPRARITCSRCAGQPIRGGGCALGVELSWGGVVLGWSCLGVELSLHTRGASAEGQRAR
jgi:hypothetical protein